MPCSATLRSPAISAEYRFRAMTGTDMPMVRRWLETPAARRWWGNPTKEAAFLVEDLDEPAMTMLIVEHRGIAFAFAQHYNVHEWPQPQFAHLPRGSRAIDVFIGNPAMIGRGHGTAFVRLLAQQLRASGVPVVTLDPDIRNTRARRAYARAGFSYGTIKSQGHRPAVAMFFTE
jgi:aminoglycoside 6'-N-acetyltransferase